MSSRLLTAWIVLSAFPSAAGAQASPALRARERRLAEMHRVALAAAERADGLGLAQMDIVREGVLTLRARPGEVPVAREAARRALVRIEHAYGDVAVLASDTAHRLASLGQFAGQVRAREERFGKEWNSPRWLRLGGEVPDIAYVENQILRGVEQVLGEHGSHAYETWNHQLTIAPFSRADAAGDLTAAYVDLVTVPSPAAGTCFDGDLRQCHVALGLAVVEDPATQWYSAPERRRVVALLTAANLPETAVRTCIERGDDVTCIRLLRSVDPARLPNPLATSTRLSLLRYALETGGPRAYLRFVNGGGTISETLSRAANTPVDSLIAGWRAAVIAARPEPVTTTASMGLVALAWCAMLSLLTLRSSRWNRV